MIILIQAKAEMMKALITAMKSTERKDCPDAFLMIFLILTIKQHVK